MARRTYIPGLKDALKTMNRYAKRWQIALQVVLTSQQYACLTAVITAVDECLISLDG